MTWLPGPVLRSLLGTIIVVYPFLVVVSEVVGVPVDAIASVVWRLGFMLVLFWVEIRRQRFDLFLLNLGISQRRVLGFVALAFFLLEVVLQAALGSVDFR